MTDDAATEERYRVVLPLQGHAARVRAGEVWHEDVPIVTVRKGEDVAPVLDGLQEDAVVLQEGAEAAMVRLDGQVLPDVPLYARRNEEAEEERVRVAEFRERKAPGEPSFFNRFLPKR